LNLAPGVLTVTDVLSVLVDAISIEAAHVMVPDAGEEPPIFSEFRALLGGMELYILRRFDFYDAARGPDVALVLASGERRIYANILLTIGVVPPE
jgi:L-fucose mutarotase